MAGRVKWLATLIVICIIIAVSLSTISACNSGSRKEDSSESARELKLKDTKKQLSSTAEQISSDETQRTDREKRTPQYWAGSMMKTEKEKREEAARKAAKEKKKNERKLPVKTTQTTSTSTTSIPTTAEILETLEPILPAIEEDDHRTTFQKDLEQATKELREHFQNKLEENLINQTLFEVDPKDKLTTKQVNRTLRMPDLNELYPESLDQDIPEAKMVKQYLDSLESNEISKSVEEERDSIIMNLNKSDILVIPTRRDNSVTMIKGNQFCIPQKTSYLRFRLNYGQLFRGLHDQTRKLKQALGKFQSAYNSTTRLTEPEFIVKRRTCPSRDKTMSGCPDSTTIALQDKASTRLRLDILQKLHKYEKRINWVITKFNSFELEFTSPDPTIPKERLGNIAQWKPEFGPDSRSLTTSLHQGNVFYLKIGEDILEPLTVIDSSILSNDSLTVELSPENFFERMIFVSAKFDAALDKLDEIVFDSEKLVHNYFPSSLFPYGHWIDQWLKTQPGNTITISDQQERSTMLMLSTLRLTSVKIDKTCDPLDQMSSIGDSCVMDGIVLIAKPTDLQMIQEVKLTPQAWKDDGKWYRIMLPVNLIYTSGHKDLKKRERFLYQQTDQELECLPYSQHLGCNYCMSNSALPPVEYQCIKEILSGKPLESCTIEEVFDEKDRNHMQIIPHANATEVVLTKDTPSNVISNCGVHENQIEVPESTKLLIHPECTKIQVIDAPNVQEVSSTVDIQSISSGHDHQPSDGIDPKFSMNPMNPKNWIEAFNVFRKAYLEINHV